MEMDFKKSGDGGLQILSQSMTEREGSTGDSKKYLGLRHAYSLVPVSSK